MTPDDAPIPEDDAIAGAARRALGRLAHSAAPVDLSWEAVQSGARRVRQRRIATVSAVCAIALVAGGAAVAVAGSRDQHASISAPSASTSTTAASSTSTSTTTTTTTLAPPCTNGACGVLGVIGGGTTPTAPSAPTGSVPVAQPGDLQGSLMLATTLDAGVEAPFTAAVRNVTDHPVRLRYFHTSGDPILGLWTDGIDTRISNAVSFVDLPNLVENEEFILAAGEQHTFNGVISPAPEQIGPAIISVEMLTIDDSRYKHVGAHVMIPGVPSVPVTIVPPGWVEGQPLDPSQGQWTATLSADASELHLGESVSVHATLHNAGNQPQLTEGYGKLAIVCNSETADPVGQFIDAATLAPGTDQTFSINFSPPNTFVGKVTCSVGVAFLGNANYPPLRPGMISDSVTITVLPASGTTTTTTTPDTSTTTTLP